MADGRRLVLVPGFLAGTEQHVQLWSPGCGAAGGTPAGRRWAATTSPPRRSWRSWRTGWRRPWRMEGGPVPSSATAAVARRRRVLAVRATRGHRLLVTLGAPLRVLVPTPPRHAGPGRGSPVARLGPAHRRGREPVAQARYEADRTAPFPGGVPFVSIYSRTDGFLDWRICLDPAAENVEIDCTHFGLTASVPAFTRYRDGPGRDSAGRTGLMPDTLHARPPREPSCAATAGARRRTRRPTSSPTWRRARRCWTWAADRARSRATSPTGSRPGPVLGLDASRGRGRRGRRRGRPAGHGERRVRDRRRLRPRRRRRQLRRRPRPPGPPAPDRAGGRAARAAPSGAARRRRGRAGQRLRRRSPGRPPTRA